MEVHHAFIPVPGLFRSRPLPFPASSVPGLFSLLSLLTLSVPCLAQDPGGSPGPGGGASSNSGYVVQCSGGSIKGAPFTATASPKPGSAGSATGIINQNAKATNGQAGTCSITASDGGPVTAQITWNGGKANTPAPPAAIVEETSTATWGGNPGDSPDFVFTPDPTAGLGSGVSSVGFIPGPGYKFTNGSGGYPESGSWTGTKYSVATSGQSTTTTCSPSFVLKGTTGVNSDSYEYCTMQYTYTATAFPVTMSLAGTTPDASGNLNILVGQGCTASLVGIPDDLANNTANPPTYSWTVSGSTFQDWGPSSPLLPDASYFNGGYGPSSNLTSHWYWYDSQQAQETVKCTVTLTPPVGQGAAFSITVTQKVSVYVPGWRATGTGTYMQVNTKAPRDPEYELWGSMGWNATVSTPTKPAFGQGTLELVQIATPNDGYTTYTQPVQNRNDPLNGITGLDTQCPYSDAVESVPYVDSDSPGLPLTSSGSTVAGSAYFQAEFTDYLMYQPPGSDVKWVPIAAFAWYTNGSASVPASGNWADYVQQNFSDSAGMVSPSTATPFKPWNTHPSWTRVVTGVAY